MSETWLLRIGILAAGFGFCAAGLVGSLSFLVIVCGLVLCCLSLAFFLRRPAGLGRGPNAVLVLEHGRKRHIRLVEQLKFPAGIGVAGVEVGVQLKSAAAVGPLEVCRVCVFFKLENVVAFFERYLAGAASHGYFRISALASQDASEAIRPFSRR